MWLIWTVVSGVDAVPVVASAKISAGVALKAPADGKSAPGGAAIAQSVEPPEMRVGSTVKGYPLKCP